MVTTDRDDTAIACSATGADVSDWHPPPEPLPEPLLLAPMPPPLALVLELPPLALLVLEPPLLALPPPPLLPPPAVVVTLCAVIEAMGAPVSGIVWNAAYV
jgi:hypothetical protein